MANNETRTPRRMPMRGPGGPGGQVGEKAKDFKGAVKRLIKELKGYKSLIIISLILAIAGAVLSISAPNQLSKLTDKVQEGLVVNKDNLQLLINKIQENISEEKMQALMMNRENTSNQIIGENITGDNIQQGVNPSEQIPGEIPTPDMINSIDIANLPKEIINMLFTEIEIDGVKISSEDQYKFAVTMKNMEENINVNELYKKIDEMPESIQKIVKPIMNIDAIKSIAIFLACLYGASAIFIFIQGICMTNVANYFARNLRSRISEKINKLPLSYFDRHQAGDTLSRVTNDVDTIAQTMNQSLGSLVANITLFLGSIIMMFYTNWIMALTAIISSLLGFMGMFMILGKSQKYFTAKQEELGNLNGHIEEIYSGLNVVKVYNGKKESDEAFDKLNLKVCEANRKSQFLSGMMQPIMGFIGNFGYVAVCIVGALLAMNDMISFGVIIAFITYVRLFTNPLSQIAQSMTSLQSTAAASERVFEFIDEKEMSEQTGITKSLDKNKVKGKIEFENVVFQYDNNDKPTIKNFTAVAEPGQKIAIVGPTGAGKTTMVNLLMKFYDINSGDIKIDGISTKDLTRENIHDLFTMVLQDTWLFDGTVKENIIYNQDHIDDEKVKEVCKEVGLDHFIRTLPNGYNSQLGENDSVSAGQRQLLTIARGMIQDTPFLILDEATSNVDTRTEELVQDAMDKLTEGKTSFIIAHRLSTIKNADLILVMKEGNIIEQGNHEELMAKQGAYAELYNSQFDEL